MTKSEIPKTCLHCKCLLSSDPLRWGIRWHCPECEKYEVIELDENPVTERFVPERVAK